MTKTEVDIAILKNDVKNIKEIVGKIEENHLPHIYDRLGKIERLIAYGMGGIAVLMVAIQVIFK